MKTNTANTTLDNFVKSYLATAAWVSFDGGKAEFPKSSKEIAKADCKKFIAAVYKEFTVNEAEAILTYQGSDLTSLAGHDFFLTRNGHGVGFWDKDIYNTLANNGGDILTKLARQMGESNCYRVKGGWVYFD